MIKNAKEMKNIRLKYKIIIYVCVAPNNSGSVGSHVREKTLLLNFNFIVDKILMVDRVTSDNFTSKLPRFTGLSTRSFFSRFSQSVDM